MRALAGWHFRPGGGPDYCRACGEHGLPCARGEPGADGRPCPYREHALISHQEHEAWAVLLTCQGQLRLAPSGHVVGLDLDAALRMGAARGCDLEVLAELLPAAEAGFWSRRWPSTAVGVTPIWVGEPGRSRRGVRTMGSQWQHQLRIDLADEAADVARRDPADPALAPLREILGRHHATMRCQFDAFADYVAEAERQGTERYPLYAWTRATIDDPAKKNKYLRSFTLYVGGEEVYAKEKADALEADLRPMVGGEVVKQMFRYDTNPANNPQPPARYRK